MEWYGGTVRQKPGPWNSLGGVKFLFPNSYNIYLHDTPSRDLFDRSSRAFSHGCIRLAEPAKLAAWLLRDDPQWTMEKIHKAMHAGKEKWVSVKYPFRVFIVYFTAWVDRKGDLNFRKDIYGRDARLEKMLTR
jgi:murein L,D-transpeptidase YcbB/YkuD